MRDDLETRKWRKEPSSRPLSLTLVCWLINDWNPRCDEQVGKYSYLVCDIAYYLISGLISYGHVSWQWAKWLWNRRVECWAIHASTSSFARTAHSLSPAFKGKRFKYPFMFDKCTLRFHSFSTHCEMMIAIGSMKHELLGRLSIYAVRRNPTSVKTLVIEIRDSKVKSGECKHARFQRGPDLWS